MNLDFQVLGPAPSGPEEVEVLIAASRKEKVEDRVAVAEAAGLKALVMDVESYAMQTAFELIRKQLPSEGRDQNVAVVDIGANVMNVTVLRNDQAVYTREQAFGGNQLTQDIARHYGMSRARRPRTPSAPAGCPTTSKPRCCGRSWRTPRWKIQRAHAVLLHLHPVQQRSTTSCSPAAPSTMPGLEDMVELARPGERDGGEPVRQHVDLAADPAEEAASPTRRR